MSFASEFEYENELDREILGLPDEGEFEGLALVPDSERVGDLFIQRISGFDWRMTTAPSTTTDSQFGSHEWLMNRASLPPTAASSTQRRFTTIRSVWWCSIASSS